MKLLEDNGHAVEHTLALSNVGLGTGINSVLNVLFVSCVELLEGSNVEGTVMRVVVSKNPVNEILRSRVGLFSVSNDGSSGD